MMFNRALAIGCVALAVAAAGLGWLLLDAHEALGAEKLKLTNANAIIAQREIDMRTSALEIAKLQQTVEQLDVTAAAARARVIQMPVTTGCGPAVRDAAGWVRDALAPPGGPPAGR